MKAGKQTRSGRFKRLRTADLPVPVFLNNEVRKLKAVITLIIYGLLLLLIKTMYDTLVDVPHLSIVAIIILLAFMLVFSVIMFNRFSRRAISNIVESADSIQEARTYAESIVASVPIPLLVLEADLGIRTANPAFLSRFKCSLEEVEKQSFFELDNGRWNIAALRAHIRPSGEGGSSDFRQLELELNDDAVGHCHLLAGGRRVELAGQSLFLLAIEDVTPRKMAEIALKDRTLELELVNRAKSEFLANMSHELRTPLNAIIGFSEVLKDGIVDGDLAPQQEEYVTDIFNSGRHLLSLINDILDMSKIEAGKMSLELEPANISSLLDSARRVIREKAVAHGIDLDFNVNQESDTVFLDVRKFRQIAYNLLSNAVKFTPDGGKVSLSARQVSAAEMFSRNPEAAPNWQGENFLELVVHDTGIGISQEDQKRLFVPFEQIDGSLSRKFEGTGLGLTMVKRLTELHGGWVGVRSRTGEGSSFSVYLPWRRDPAPEMSSPVRADLEPRKADRRSLSLLLLSRNESLRQRIQEWCMVRGHQITALTGYGQGWEWLNRHKPSLVLLDVEYPRLDGIRMLIQIKGLPQFRTLPVLLLMEVSAGGQGAVLAPAAFTLFPFSPDSIRTVLDGLGLATKPAGPDGLGRALLVEADERWAHQGSEVLQALGWEVSVASGGMAGVDAVLRQVPDLVVVNAVQPDISGFELVHLLEERPETRQIPVVLVLDPNQPDADMHAMRPGLFALLRPGGINLDDDLAAALDRLVPGDGQ